MSMRNLGIVRISPSFFALNDISVYEQSNDADN